MKVGYDNIAPISIGHGLPLVYVGGPCAIESREHAFRIAEAIAVICNKVGMEWIYRS